MCWAATDGMRCDARNGRLPLLDPECIANAGRDLSVSKFCRRRLCETCRQRISRLIFDSDYWDREEWCVNTSRPRLAATSDPYRCRAIRQVHPTFCRRLSIRTTRHLPPLRKCDRDREATV